MDHPDYTLLIPEYIALGAAFGIIALELIWPRFDKRMLAVATAAAAVAYAVATLFYLDGDPETFQGVLAVDNFTNFFRLLGAGVVAVVSLMSATYMSERTRSASEYYGLLLFAAVGATGMAAARELITAYISLELLSFSLYILTGYLKREVTANEASLKYILLGGFSSAMLLYGISLLYGLFGSTFYDEIAAGIAGNVDDNAGGLVVALMLVVAGVGFKVAAAPFHMWSPDAYQGAPLPITAFLSTLSKAAGFALILRLFTNAFGTGGEEWRWAIAALAALTMTGGNLLAIQQTNLKRLVAYSSIGQVGYMLVSIAALGYGSGSDTPLDASTTLLVHIAGYVVSTLALFTALTAFHNRTGKDDIADLRGLAETQPFLAVVITASLFSFAGLPFFAGFTTKMLMFQASTTDGLLWLVGLAVANSFVSLYYYLMVMRQMYLFDPEPGQGRYRVNPLLWNMAGLLLLGVVAIGVYPAPLLEGAERAAQDLFAAPGAEALATLP